MRLRFVPSRVLEPALFYGIKGAWVNRASEKPLEGRGQKI